VIAAGESVVIVATAHGCKFSQTTIGYHTGRLAGIEPRHANRIVEADADAAAIETLIDAT
jgi:threonine synthase